MDERADLIEIICVDKSDHFEHIPNSFEMFADEKAYQDRVTVSFETVT